MILPSAIKRYLNGNRDDHRWMKELKSKELDKLLNSLEPKPKFWPGLGVHQKIGLYLGIKLGCFAFWYDMGTGKTVTNLELLQYWWDIGEMRRALVFVTSDKAFPTWERQIRQYKINIPYCTLDSNTSAGKWKALANFDEGLILLHYPGAVAMVKGGGKKLDKAKLKRLLRSVDVVVFDESTKAGNTQSLTHRLCRAASRQALHRYALAGRPFGRDPTPLWAQLFLVDRGESLGPTLELFREAFFTKEKNKDARGPRSKYAFDYTFRERMKPKLSRMTQHSSLTYVADECIDLPPERRIPELIKLPADTRAYYDELVAEVIAAKGNFRAIEGAFHRMRMLSSGFIGLKDDLTGERAEIEFDPNPKMDRLLDLASTFPDNRKALIFYQYTYSGRNIVKRFKEEFGIDVPWLWSGTKNSRKMLSDFIDGDAPFCCINNQVGAYSLDGLQVANYTFVYESPVSSIDREQLERRTRRQGQKHRTVFYYDLIVKGTVDEKILQFHQEGKDLFDSLLVNPKALLR